ncbi:MAG: InlB B-repeat-containing protein, partial [Coriobacteriia bacterium]|nr:InlB B-repeat-containing protein [Coriobacteriia bacterium]
KNDTPDPIQKATVKFMVTDPETDEILFDQSVDTTEGSKVSLPAGLPALEGYSLDHWVDQNGASYQAALSDFVAPAGDTTLLAQWTKNDTPDPIVKVNVTFIATTPGTTDVVYDTPFEAVSGDPVVVPTDLPTFDGYTLTGFVDKAGNAYDANLTGYVAPKADDVLYAQYTANETPAAKYDVTIIATTPGTDEVAFDETNSYEAGATLTVPENLPTFDGYTLTGFMDQDGKTYKADLSDFTVAGKTTLMAQYEKDETPVAETYKVTFDTDGGSEVAEQTVNMGEAPVEPATPTKDGFKFGGWTLDGEPYGFKTALDKDVTLKAVWNKIDDEQKPSESEDKDDSSTSDSKDDTDKKDESKKDESQKKDQLPKTGDDTNVAGLAAAGAAGVAALGAGAVLLNRRKREQN